MPEARGLAMALENFRFSLLEVIRPNIRSVWLFFVRLAVPRYIQSNPCAKKPFSLIFFT